MSNDANKIESEEENIRLEDRNIEESTTDTINKTEWELKRKVNKVFRECGETAPDAKAVKYLEKAETKYKKYVTQLPPIRPRAGQVFLYKPNYQMKKITINEHYAWYSTEYTFSKENKTIKRQKYYATSNTSRSYNTKFSRVVYFSIEKEIKDRVYLIAYLGDEKTYTDVSHGNRKFHKERIHFQTEPLLLSSIELINKTPSVIYKEKICEQTAKLEKLGDNYASAYERLLLPKDTKQISNKLYALRKTEKLSKDSIYNIYEIAMNLEPFVFEFKLIPELQVVFRNLLLIMY